MKRIGLSIAIAAALGLSACGGSSSSSSGGSSASTVSGTASKGIIVGGLVSAYLFDANGNPEATAIATATTDASGKYSLTIPTAHKGKPLYIDISNNAANGDAATMKCDIAAGCGGDIAFGDAYELDADFSLGAVLPEAGTEVAVNLTPFTTAAAKKAINDISLVGGGLGVANLISNANSSVANSLNDILGSTLSSVNDIPVVDLTDPAAVAVALAAGGSVNVKVAALNAAIVTAVQGDNDGYSIEEAIEEFTDNLSDTPLVGNASDGSVTDVAEILAEAEEVLGKVADAVTDAGVEITELDELAEEITDIQEAAEAEDPDEEVDDTPSPNAGSESLVKVKAFIEELRELGTVIDGKTLQDDGETIETILEGFDLQVEAADMAVSDDAELAMEALARAVAAIVDVYDLNFDTETGNPTVESELTTFPVTITSEQEALDVEISLDAGVYSFSVVDEAVTAELEESNDSITIAAVAKEPVASVDVTATINTLSVVEVENEAATEGNTTTEDGSIDGEVDINIAGTVSTTEVDLTVSNGIVKGELDVEWAETESETDNTIESLTAAYLLSGYTFSVDNIEDVEELTFSEGGSGSIRFSPNQDNNFDENDVNNISWTVTEAGVLNFTETDGGNDTWDWVFTPTSITASSVSFDYTVAASDGGSDSGSGSITASQTSGGTSIVETNEASFDLNNLVFDLDVILSQKSSDTVTDPLTFTGGLEFTVSNLNHLENETYNHTQNSFESEEEYTYSLDVVELDITGSFANTSGESFDMAFNVSANASNVPSLIETFENGDKTESTGGETDTNYAAAEASLTFDAELEGVSDAVTFSFEVERVGYDDIDASVMLSYPGRSIMIDASAEGLDSDESGSASLTLTNNDGVVMAVEADDSAENEDDEVTGTIKVEGDSTIYAELANVNGIDIIRYSDGTFVSAF